MTPMTWAAAVALTVSFIFCTGPYVCSCKRRHNYSQQQIFAAPIFKLQQLPRPTKMRNPHYLHAVSVCASKLAREWVIYKLPRIKRDTPHQKVEKPYAGFLGENEGLAMCGLSLQTRQVTACSLCWVIKQGTECPSQITRTKQNKGVVSVQFYGMKQSL